MIKTNDGLVDYALKQLGKPYWYGTFGNTATQALLNAKTKQYPSHYYSSRIPTYKSQFGKKVFDCVGLIKGYLWSDSPNSAPKYNASQDVSADGMKAVCTDAGKMDSMPEQKGILVFQPGHVGIYIGSGYVVEARGFAFGVVKTPLKSRGWTSWGRCPWIDYDSETEYFKRYTGISESIVDALKSIGFPSSFEYRKSIAEANGIKNYSGLAQQNEELLSRLRSGSLIKPK